MNNEAVGKIAQCLAGYGTVMSAHKEDAKRIYEAGYRLVPKELKGLEVKPHSESIWCPHCGEEFGIESEIEYAHEAQAEDIKRQIKEYNR